MWGHRKFVRTETKVCLIVWISAVLYSIYQFAIVSQKYFHQYHDHYGDFKPGWSILGFLRQDKADFEWETICFFVQRLYPVMVLYSLACEVLLHLSNDVELQKYFQILFPILYITYSMGYRIVLLAILQPMLFRLIATLRSNKLIWICNLICLVLITIYKKMCSSDDFLKDVGINHFEAFLSVLLLCWMNLKCTSFSLNMPLKAGLLEYLTYCFYFPTIFVGPFIGFNDFHDRTYVNYKRRLKHLVVNIIKCIFWLLFVEFWLHFVYVNATSFQLELVRELDLCSLCGYGYLMGQFFHIKYVVLYGLSTTLAAFDNIRVPRLPRCIGRVHLYSDMWKYFDPGLYNFLKKCIFLPSIKSGLNKFGASLLCFLFVFVWHGIEYYIFLWALLNFIGVVLEDQAYKFYTTKLKSIMRINGSNLRRLKCLAAAPLLALSAISNFYFFAGKDIGGLFVQKSLNEPLSNQLLVLLVLYCCCQVSTELREVEARTCDIGIK